MLEKRRWLAPAPGGDRTPFHGRRGWAGGKKKLSVVGQVGAKKPVTSGREDRFPRDPSSVLAVKAEAHCRYLTGDQLTSPRRLANVSQSPSHLNIYLVQTVLIYLQGGLYLHKSSPLIKQNF